MPTVRTGIIDVGGEVTLGHWDKLRHESLVWVTPSASDPSTAGTRSRRCHPRRSGTTEIVATAQVIVSGLSHEFETSHQYDLEEHPFTVGCGMLVGFAI